MAGRERARGRRARSGSGLWRGPPTVRNGLAVLGPGVGTAALRLPAALRYGSPERGSRDGTVPFLCSHGSKKEASANQGGLSDGPETPPKPRETCCGFEDQLRSGMLALGACGRLGGAGTRRAEGTGRALGPRSAEGRGLCGPRKPALRPGCQRRAPRLKKKTNTKTPNQTNRKKPQKNPKQKPSHTLNCYTQLPPVNTGVRAAHGC